MGEERSSVFLIIKYTLGVLCSISICVSLLMIFYSSTELANLKYDTEARELTSDLNN
jgi:hypothetical protein